ncbi:MAG TPA: metallopeptidase TldD-related protein [Acidimicrobiales bacterium]
MTPAPAAGLPAPHEVVEAALDAAGGRGCVVVVEESNEAEVRFANNSVTTNGLRRDRRVTVVSFAEVAGGVSAGVARHGGDVDVESLVAAARADALGSEPADDAAPLLGPGDVVVPAGGRGVQRFEDPPGRSDLGVLDGVLSGLGAAFERAGRPGVDRVLAGFAEHGVSTVYLGTSTGVRLAHRQPTGALHLVARSRDGSRSAWAGRGTERFADVSVDELEEQLAGRLEVARNRIDVAAGRHQTVLPPEATADLMVALVEAMGGQDAEDGRTVFSRRGGGTRVGEVVARLPFDLRSDPAEAGLACTPFVVASASSAEQSVFDNGLPLARTNWVRAGRLERLRYHRAGAARSQVEPTPPIDNVTLELPGATGSTDDLVRGTERGLLVTCLWYIREVDPTTLLLTGLTRDGVYVVEDGRVVGVANNFRFNESPLDLLDRATEAGASVRALGREFGEWLNRAAMPPLRIPDFNMSSVSQAS